MILTCGLAGCASFSIDKVKYYNEVIAKVGDKMVESFKTDKINTDLLKQLFGTEGISITDELLKNYVDEGELDLSKVLADLNFTGEDAFDNFVNKFGQNAG